MTEALFATVNFIPKGDSEFGNIVRKRVSEYFTSNGISRTGDYRIWIKIIILPVIYLAPFVLIMTNWYSSTLWAFYGLWAIMGIGLAGCGLGIMHDACHGAISKSHAVNNFIGELILGLAAGSTTNWKIQHNLLHHSYTNIDGYDEDIDPGGVMRFSPHQPVKPFYRFQVIYAWFVYGLMTFFWATFKDYLQLNRYNKKGLVNKYGSTFKIEFLKLVLQKILYYGLFIALPIIFLDIAWWHVVLGWFSMHFIAGVILGCVFQPAHVVPTSEFPLPDGENKIEGDWAKYQMLTTANFAPGNRLLSWYIGGLNYQIEHHLFPNMSHVHHRRISRIVKQTAEEYGVPYNSQPTFLGALANHAKTLHKFRK